MNPHQRCLQVEKLNEPKQVMPKSNDLSRSILRTDAIDFGPSANTKMAAFFTYNRPLDDLFPDFLLYFHLLSPT